MDVLIQKGVALITGAGSGMGQATAIKFVEHGCTNLFLVDIREEGLQATKKLVQERSTSAKVVLHTGDISKADSVKAMVAAGIDAFGRIDFAINNAGVAIGGIKTADMSLEVFDENCIVNEKGTYLCEKYEIEQMLKQEPLPVFDDEFSQDRGIRGSIVNTSSLSALVTLRDFSAYTSSKHGVGILTKQTAREYAPYKIRINSVCPGAVNTPMIMKAGLTKDFLEKMSRQAPMNRWIHAAEVAETIVFLSSSRASAITGVNLPVDCGAALYHSV